MSIGQIIFTLVVVVAFSIAAKNYKKVYRNINLGKDEDISGDEGQRWKNLLLIAFGQKKMFKRWIPAVLHLAIYVAFLFNLLKIPRLVKPEMGGWPTLDANLILLGEIALVTGIFMMNGADVVLQQLDPEHYPSSGFLPISSINGPLLFGDLGLNALQLIERT